MVSSDQENKLQPFDLVNVFVEVGNILDIANRPVDDDTIIKEVSSRIQLDALQTSHLTLNEIENAFDVIKIRPEDYFEVGMKTGKIGLQVTMKSISRLKRAYEIFNRYKDPRYRDQDLIRAESFIEACLKEGKLTTLQDESDLIELALSKIRIPPGLKIDRVTDIPRLEWRRTQEDIQLISQMLLLTMVAILKKGGMVNPELIRLLNLVRNEALVAIMSKTSIFVKSRITVSFQRLADIMYLTNFGILEQEIHYTIIEDMFDNPIEDRTNLPQSEASDVVNFLNQLREQFPEFEKLTKLSRKIGVLTKPISEEAPNFIGFNSSGDAIREVLSVIHYSMDNEDVETQIQTIVETVTDPDFMDVVRYYFDPSYELLHTPFLTQIQTTIERMQVLISGRFLDDNTFFQENIEVVQNKLNEILEYLGNSQSTKQFAEIWTRINNYVKLNVQALVKSKTKKELYELIKGKTIILNLMTPLLLAKYENRGFNPLAAKVDEKLESHLKSITGIIAVGSNLSMTDLENLLNTVFITAPEAKKDTGIEEGAEGTNIPPGPPGIPKPSGPPTPGPPKPGGSVTKEQEGSHLIPTKMGIGLARIANEYVTGGGERNLHRALIDLIKFTKHQREEQNKLVG